MKRDSHRLLPLPNLEQSNVSPVKVLYSLITLLLQIEFTVFSVEKMELNMIYVGSVLIPGKVLQIVGIRITAQTKNGRIIYYSTVELKILVVI